MKKHIRLLNISVFLALAFMLLMPSWAIASFTRENWQYHKQLVVDPGITETTKYAQVQLDGQIYNHSAVGGMADLRIVSGTSTEVPYYLYNDNQSIEEKSYPVTILNNSVVAGEYSSFVVDLGQNNLPNNRLNIEVSDNNFLRRVEIAGADNLKSSWNKLPTTDHIFEFQGQRSTQVHYALNNFRYLRVMIWNKGERPLTINGAQVFYNNQTPVSEQESKALFTTTENKDNKTTELTFDLGYANFPTHRILLDCEDDNFSRQVSIQGSNDGTNWRQEGDYYTIYSYNIDNHNGKSLSLTYPELPFRYVRLVVQNKDNPPLKFRGGKVYTMPYKAIFPYEKGTDYQLYYGNPKAQIPQYDLSQVVSFMTTNKVPMLKLSAEQLNPGYVPEKKPWTEENKWVLWVALGLVVLVLGTAIVKTMNKLGAE